MTSLKCCFHVGLLQANDALLTHKAGPERKWPNQVMCVHAWVVCVYIYIFPSFDCPLHTGVYFHLQEVCTVISCISLNLDGDQKQKTNKKKKIHLFLTALATL